MKMVLLYHKKLLSFNLPFSLFVGIMGVKITGGFFLSFWLSLMTGGFLLSFYFYEIRYKMEYYFFLNKGYSRLKLILYSYLLNTIFIILFILIKNLFND